MYLRAIQMEFNDLWEDEGIGIEHIVTPIQPHPVQPTVTRIVPISEPVIDPSTRSTRQRPPPTPRTSRAQPVRSVVNPVIDGSDTARRQPPRRRPNVLERRSEQLSREVPASTKSAPRINRYIAPDNTTLSTKMNVGFDIARKKPRDGIVARVDDPDWYQKIDYNRLFKSTGADGYSVGDIRTLINKTQLMNVNRSIWDRNRLLAILIDYLIDRGVYQEVKDLARLHRDDWYISVLEQYQSSDELANIMADHYQENRVWEVLRSNQSSSDMRRTVQEIPNVDEVYDYVLINENRNRVVVEQLAGNIFGDVLYVDDVGNSNIVDFLPTDLASVTTASLRDIDTIEGQYNIIILDHILDLYLNDRRALLDKLKTMLRPNGRIVIISYDYGLNSVKAAFRDPPFAYTVFNGKRLLEDYMIPDEPHIDLEMIKFDYPDEPQIRSWMGIDPRDIFITSGAHDPIVEVARVY